MKKYILFLLTILILSSVSYAQSMATTSFRASDLIGTWTKSYDNDKSNYLVFKKKTDTKYKYGLSIEFLKNGEFYSKYIAPCGNDSMLKTHNYNGKWQLNEKDWTIRIIKPISGKESFFKIVLLQSDKLILEEIKVE